MTGPGLIAVGTIVLLTAAFALVAEGDERGSLTRHSSTPQGAASLAVRDDGPSLGTAEVEHRPQDVRRLMNACAGKTTPSYWIEKLRDRDPDTRVRAAQALGETRDRTAVPALVHALNDANQDVRVAAVRALGRIGPGASRAVPALRAMLAENDERLRGEVSRSLEEITLADRK